MEPEASPSQPRRRLPLPPMRRRVQEPVAPLAPVVCASVDADHTRATLAKGINDYLNLYIQFMDTKAAAFLAGNVAAATLLLNALPAHPVGRALFWGSAALFAASIAWAASTILPRKPRGSQSVVFWGDIAARPDAATYRDDFVQACVSGQMDDQYAMQNFLSAQVLRRKFQCLRRCILFFFAALFSALGARLCMVWG